MLAMMLAVSLLRGCLFFPLSFFFGSPSNGNAEDLFVDRALCSGVHETN